MKEYWVLMAGNGDYMVEENEMAGQRRKEEVRESSSTFYNSLKITSRSMHVLEFF